MQGSSRHQLNDEWAFGFGLRMGLTDVRWQHDPNVDFDPIAPNQKQYNNASWLYLNHQPIFWIVNPIF
ncbi:MAG: hypothetical protein ACK417_12295 [Bacteroidia bacterium]